MHGLLILRALVALKAFALRDIHGLSGGQALWASADRTAFIQVVGHDPGHAGLWEKRYKTKLTAEQWMKFERLVETRRFLTLEIPERTGANDEARPSITVVTQAGVTSTVSKRANDTHADFDAVYSFLLELCRARNGALIREGTYEWNWRPPGFATFD